MVIIPFGALIVNLIRLVIILLLFTSETILFFLPNTAVCESRFSTGSISFATYTFFKLSFRNFFLKKFVTKYILYLTMLKNSCHKHQFVKYPIALLFYIHQCTQYFHLIIMLQNMLLAT